MLPQKQRMECFRLLFDHLASIEHQFLSGIRDSRKAGSLWGMMRGVGGVKKSIHQSWLAIGLGLGLGLLCWGFKGVQQEIPSEEASTLQISGISTRSMHQSTTPRWASRQFLSLPIVQTLLPVTFGYSLSSEAVVMRQLRRWKRLWRRSLTRSHKRTSIGPSNSCWNDTTGTLQPEEITSKGTTVSCVYYQWKCPYEKSLEKYRMHLVCIYICMYVCVCVCETDCYRMSEKQFILEFILLYWPVLNTFFIFLINVIFTVLIWLLHFFFLLHKRMNCPVSWGCRIHWL